MRFHRWAEREFAKLCAAEDVICNHAEEDESGWSWGGQSFMDPNKGTGIAGYIIAYRPSEAYSHVKPETISMFFMG